MQYFICMPRRYTISEYIYFVSFYNFEIELKNLLLKFNFNINHYNWNYYYYQTFYCDLLK